MLLYKQLKTLSKNHKKLPKNSFALIEILISILLISFIFISFLNLADISSKNNTYYKSLLNLENSLAKKEFVSFSKSNINLNAKINDNNEILNLSLYKYEDENIRLFFYEK